MANKCGCFFCILYGPIEMRREIGGPLLSLKKLNKIREEVMGFWPPPKPSRSIGVNPKDWGWSKEQWGIILAEESEKIARFGA